MVPHSSPIPFDRHVPAKELGSEKRRATKLRLALGLFADLAAACATARELCSAGVQPSMISLAAPPDVIAGSAGECRRCLDWDGFARTASRAAAADDAAPASCSPGQPGCCGTMLPIGPATAGDPGVPPGSVAALLSDHLQSRPMRQQARCVREHLAARRWLLVVILTDAEQEHDVCTTLLRHARFGMQTHEIRRA